MARTLLASLVALAALSCAIPKGTSIEERRSYVREMRDDTLDLLYQAEPELRPRVRSAIGYAVFSNVAVQVFVVGGGQGYGLAHDNRTGEEIYMRMAELEGGIGWGMKDFRAVFVFHDDAAFRTFVDIGWQFGASAEASAIAEGDKGIAVGAQGGFAGGAPAGSLTGTAGVGAAPPSAAASVGQGVEVYQLTKNGVALRAGVTGTRYWKDSALN